LTVDGMKSFTSTAILAFAICSGYTW
jgi:hypothetical protein